MARSRLDLLAESSLFVDKLFRERLPEWAVYHNLAHTTDVVASCREIGEGSGLSDHEMEILLIAAWFHDTGYVAVVKGHEDKSIEIASQFLGDNGYPRRGIARIAACIRATRVPQRPATRLERVLCDADLNSVGRESFFLQNELLRAEIERRKCIALDETAWLRRSYRFLRRHRFHTRYARARLEEGRVANIARLKKSLQGTPPLMNSHAHTE